MNISGYGTMLKTVPSYTGASVFSSLIKNQPTRDQASMSIEHRRSERIIDYLPLEVHAVSGSDGQPIAGPFSGSIIDISAHGACLLMPQVFHNGFHLFYSTRDTSNTVLQLTINHPPDIINCIP